MKTLKSEARKLGGPLFSVRNGHCSTTAAWEAGFARGLGEYKDYRVVEGVLTTGRRMEDGWTEVLVSDPKQGFRGGISIGVCGRRVKLLLPPEEKVQSDPLIDELRQEIATLEACQEIQETREADLRWRADRYEKALRGIADAHTRLLRNNPPSRDRFWAGLVDGSASRAGTARRALEDE